MASKSRIQLEEWLKTIEPTGKVADVGGSQNPIEGRTKNWNVESYHCIDLCEPHETKRRPDIMLDIQKDLTETNAVDFYGNFDTVFCIEVAEYWYDPMQALWNLARLLKKNGILYISFHFLYGLHNPKGEDCLRYTKNAIVKIAEATGFAITDIKTKMTSDPGLISLEEFYRREGMRLDFRDPQTYEEGYLVTMKKL